MLAIRRCGAGAGQASSALGGFQPNAPKEIAALASFPPGGAVHRAGAQKKGRPEGRPCFVE
jgi:hypothetical protein